MHHINSASDQAFFFFLTGGGRGQFFSPNVSMMYISMRILCSHETDTTFEECLTPVEYDVSLTNIEGNQHRLQAHSSGAV